MRAVGAVRKGVSTMALVGFAAAYFSIVSLGSVAWVGMALAPWLASSQAPSMPGGVDPRWAWLGTAWAFAWALSAARSIHRLSQPRMRRSMPGGSWVAWSVVAWLAWMDAALALGRGAPEGFQAAARPGNPRGGEALGWAVARAAVAIPGRSMACALALAMMVAMPLVLHVAMAMALPLVLADFLLPQGPAIGLLDRVKRAAIDMSKEGSEGWALAEREQIDKEVGKSLSKMSGGAGARPPADGEQGARRSRRL